MSKDIGDAVQGAAINWGRMGRNSEESGAWVRVEIGLETTTCCQEAMKDVRLVIEATVHSLEF